MSGLVHAPSRSFDHLFKQRLVRGPAGSFRCSFLQKGFRAEAEMTAFVSQARPLCFLRPPLSHLTPYPPPHIDVKSLQAVGILLPLSGEIVHTQLNRLGEFLRLQAAQENAKLHARLMPPPPRTLPCRWSRRRSLRALLCLSCRTGLHPYTLQSRALPKISSVGQTTAVLRSLLYRTSSTTKPCSKICV